MKPDPEHPPARPPTTKAKIWEYPVMGVLPSAFSLGGPWYLGLPEIFGGTSIPIASYVKPLWLPGNQKVDNSRNNSAPGGPSNHPGSFLYRYSSFLHPHYPQQLHLNLPIKLDFQALSSTFQNSRFRRWTLETWSPHEDRNIGYNDIARWRRIGWVLVVGETHSEPITDRACWPVHLDA